MSLLSCLPKPFLDDIVGNRCIPFIGAGFSKNADLPLGKTIPDWKFLGEEALRDLPEYDAAGPLDALSAYAHVYSKAKLLEFIRKALIVDDSEPGAAHYALCQIPFDVICTTNFDFLLERAYQKQCKSHVVVVDEAQLSLAPPSGAVQIVKFHGDLHHPNHMVVTEEDYDTFINQRPLLSTNIANYLICRTPLFIGYSLDDPDFRQIWQTIKSRLGNLRRHAYAVTIEGSDTDRARFARRGVTLISLPGKRANFASILPKFLEEIRHHWLGQISTTVVVTDDGAANALGGSSHNKPICFVSAPVRIISWYKKYIYPRLIEMGFYPIAADDYILAEDNTVAKISSLLDVSKIIICEPATSFANFELGQAVSLGAADILIVRTADMSPSGYLDLSPRVIEIVLDDDRDEAVENISAWIRERGEKLGLIGPGYRRLMEMKEYSHAVVDVFSHIERELHEWATARAASVVKASSIWVSAAREALRQKVISPKDFDELRQISIARNNWLHRSVSILPTIATNMVNSGEALLRKIKK
jgi:hypothetical protein